MESADLKEVLKRLAAKQPGTFFNERPKVRTIEEERCQQAIHSPHVVE